MSKVEHRITIVAVSHDEDGLTNEDMAALLTGVGQHVGAMGLPREESRTVLGEERDGEFPVLRLNLLDHVNVESARYSGTDAELV